MLDEISLLRAKLKALPRLENKERVARIKEAKSSFEYFVKTYFKSHLKLPDNSKFRNDFYKNALKFYKTARFSLFTAYRGAAKTTLVGRFYPLWRMRTQKDAKNCVIIGATLDLAKKSLDFIKDELENNELLREDFAIAKGSKWTEYEIIFYCGGEAFKISAYGAGTKIRGENWRGKRPDLIICDDLENDENVKTKAQRDKLEEWFYRTITKLPSRKDNTYNIIVIGTMLHYDCLLARLKKDETFKIFDYPLVLKFPSSQNPRNLDDFILDDSDLDKKEYFAQFLRNKDSFMSEYQNLPLCKDSALFSDYQICHKLPACQAYYIGIDPALGKAKGDYFAIAILGLSGGKFYAKVMLQKIKPAKMIERIISLYLSLLNENSVIKIAIETVQFQEFFKDELDKKAKERGIYLPLIPLKNSIPKELRIDSIAVPINNGDIIIEDSELIFLEELDTYPKSAHDDGLDALEMAWRIAKVPHFDYAKANELLKQRQEKEQILDEFGIFRR